MSAAKESEFTERGASLVAILDQLSALVGNARAMPMSASVLVNKAETLDLLAAATAVVPDEIRAAAAVNAEADAVLQRAKAEADALLAEAHRRAQELVGREQVVALAQERAHQIIADAEEQAAQLARDADDYCDRQLAQFEIDLGAIGAQVQAGRQRLASRGTQPGEES
ncbi:MAG TPA: ATPase [Actinomycetaceae bacterium]|nr:ATPase [Actinomycetaceae bacterium]